MSVREVQWFIPLKLEGNEPILLFSACDARYFGYAASLIRGVDLFSPGFSFVLHLINPEQTLLERVQQLAASLNATRLVVSFENINLSRLEEEQKRAYFSCARFPQIAKLLRQYQCPIFSLDADSLVVNPIDLNFSDKIDAEVVIIRRDLKEEMPEHLSVATGSIWLKPTQGVFQFIDDVSKQVDTHLQEGTLKWFVDQVVFHQQMQVMQKEVRFYNLKGKYADWDFLESSIIWAGKGLRKENDMRYFLLKALLSDDAGHHMIANQLWSSICTAGSGLSSSQWMRSRMEIARKSVARIALYIPRLDLPWKRDSDISSSPPLLADDVLDLRLYWKAFAVKLANAIERAGLPVDVIEKPAWEIDRKAIEASGTVLALIPHRCRFDFDEGDTPVLFYMQEYFRWVFVLNESGWSAASSIYPIHLEAIPELVHDSFGTYRQRLLADELGSKFAQPVRKSHRQLIAEGLIPMRRGTFGLKHVRPYIFLPLQIPHDQSIHNFSDLTEQHVVESLVNWAQERDITVVMKPHPVNRKSTASFEKLADGRTVFWSEAHVYDLIAHATCVYTVNSGVGFEALLHLKPVVTFGRVEYDCVSFQATPDTLDAAWDFCMHADTSMLEKRYRHFVNWFLGAYAVDMSQSEHAHARLEQLASEVVAQARAATVGEVW